MLTGFTAVGWTEDRSHAGAAGLVPRNDGVGKMAVRPVSPGLAPGPRNDGVSNRSRSRAGAVYLGPRKDDVETMIMGGTATPAYRWYCVVTASGTGTDHVQARQSCYHRVTMSG